MKRPIPAEILGPHHDVIDDIRDYLIDMGEIKPNEVFSDMTLYISSEELVEVEVESTEEIQVPTD